MKSCCPLVWGLDQPSFLSKNKTDGSVWSIWFPKDPGKEWKWKVPHSHRLNRPGVESFGRKGLDVFEDPRCGPLEPWGKRTHHCKASSHHRGKGGGVGFHFDGLFGVSFPGDQKRATVSCFGHSVEVLLIHSYPEGKQPKLAQK